MITGIRAEIRRGYTGYDHLIDNGDEIDVINAIVGRQLRSCRDAAEKANKAFWSQCDRRVRSARIDITMRYENGREITLSV